MIQEQICSLSFVLLPDVDKVTKRENKLLEIEQTRRAT